jgi:hypothetical protein
MQRLFPRIALSAVSLGIVFAAAPASAQTSGPGGAYFGAGSGPQSGGQPAAGTTAAPQAGMRTLYNSARQQPAATSAPSVGPAGPAGANYGAGTNPQNGR